MLSILSIETNATSTASINFHSKKVIYIVIFCIQFYFDRITTTNNKYQLCKAKMYNIKWKIMN